MTPKVYSESHREKQDVQARVNKTKQVLSPQFLFTFSSHPDNTLEKLPKW